jgi:hypothetical protein
MMLLKFVAGLMVVALGLAGCESLPTQAASSAPPKSQVQFVDLQDFDRDLGQSLSAPLPSVDVAFYDRVTPSALPERLQKWMASVEAGGGTVKVTQPPSTVTAKNPFLLISLIHTIWVASKSAKEYSQNAQYKAAQAYDAEIKLKVDDKGDTVVDKVAFVRRAK